MPKPKTKTSKAVPPPAPKEQPPSWPPFKPALPVLPLEPSTHPETSKIVLLQNFFPRSLCRDYVAFFKTLPLQTTPGKPKRGEAVRVNDRFQVDDAAFAERLWSTTGLKEAITEDESLKELWGGEPAGLSPNIRVYRYSKGQYFDCHYDDSNNLTLFKDPPVSVRTTWTLLLYLTSSSEGCEGGETVFYTHDRKTQREAISVPPETGLLLLHKHGDDCLLVVKSGFCGLIYVSHVKQTRKSDASCLPKVESSANLSNCALISASGDHHGIDQLFLAAVQNPSFPKYRKAAEV